MLFLLFYRIIELLAYLEREIVISSEGMNGLNIGNLLYSVDKFYKKILICFKFCIYKS